MKIERLLLGLFASFLMVGCSQNDDLPNESEEAKGKDSYISIKINADMSGMDSRATTPTFSAGSAEENDVNSVHFFFFDKLGNAFNVPVPKVPTADGGENVVDGIDENGSNYNWIKVNEPDVIANSTAAPGTNVNIEKELQAIVVFKVQNNTYPSQVIAVLNWNYNGTAALNKSTLMTELINEATAIGKPAEDAASQANTDFIMSNSVYMGENGATIDAQSISEANFAPTPTDAVKEEKTIKLSVERVAVKVNVDVNKTETANGYLNTGAENAPIHAFQVAEAPNIYGQGENETRTPIYAQILAWDLNTTNSQSYLVKKFGENWNTDYPYQGWNDYSNKRSYYADAYNGSYNSKFTWGGIKNPIGGSDYCLENTNTTAINATKVIVKGRLVVANLNGGYDPVTVCQWYSSYYVGTDALKTAVAKSVNIYEKGENNNYTQVSGSNINVIGVFNEADPNAYDAYKVTFSVPTTASDGTSKTWYKKVETDSGESYIEYNDTEVNTAFSGLPEAKVWQDGATYYFTDIKHENNASAVIRNHVYDVSIEGVKGLGTPVYYPDDNPGEEPNPDPNDEPEIPNPVVPEETETYIAAKINVLSWKLVENDVVLGQK